MTTSNTTFSETGNVVIKAASRISRLSLRFSERKLLLAFVDVLLLNITFIVTIGMRAGLRFSFYSLSHKVSLFSFYSLSHKVSWFVSLITIWFVCSSALECYNLFRAASIRRSLPHIGGASIITSAIYLVIPYVTPPLPSSRLVALSFPVLALVSLVTWRIIYARVFFMP